MVTGERTRPWNEGDRIELLIMPQDPAPIEPGTKGTVSMNSVWLGDCWQTMVDWDDGRHLAVISGIDQVKRIR
jgi:hypothetical protein